VKTQKMVLMK